MADRFEELSHAMTDLDILGAEGLLGRMPIDEAQGIEAKLRRLENVLIFEAKIPLAKKSRYLYSIGTEAGKRIGMGLESPEFKMPDAFTYDPAQRSGGPVGSVGPVALSLMSTVRRGGGKPSGFAYSSGSAAQMVVSSPMPSVRVSLVPPAFPAVFTVR